MRLATLSLTATLLITVGCGGGSTGTLLTTEGPEIDEVGNFSGPTTSIMLMYSGATFVSTDRDSQGLLRFTNDEVFWTQSDIVENGTYSDNGETNLIASFASGDIPFSDAGGNVTWNSVEYQRAARSQFDSQESLDAYLDGADYRSLDLLPGGEGEGGVQIPANWTMTFEAGNSFYGTRDTVTVGTPFYVDGSTFDIVYGDNGKMTITMLENDQMVISGSVYERDFSDQFDSNESLNEFLNGTSYESVNLQQMGAVVDGAASVGRWRIDFSEGSFQWFYEDVAEAGTVSYLQYNDFLATFNDRELTIEVDGNDIVWDGVRYTKVPN